MGVFSKQKNQAIPPSSDFPSFLRKLSIDLCCTYVYISDHKTNINKTTKKPKKEKKNNETN